MESEQRNKPSSYAGEDLRPRMGLEERTMDRLKTSIGIHTVIEHATQAAVLGFLRPVLDLIAGALGLDSDDGSRVQTGPPSVRPSDANNGAVDSTSSGEAAQLLDGSKKTHP